MKCQHLKYPHIIYKMLDTQCPLKKSYKTLVLPLVGPAYSVKNDIGPSTAEKVKDINLRCELISLLWVNTFCKKNTIIIVFQKRFLQVLFREDAIIRWPLKVVQVIRLFIQYQIPKVKYLWLFINLFYFLGVIPRSTLSKRFMNLVKICYNIYCFALSFHTVQFLVWWICILS